MPLAGSVTNLFFVVVQQQVIVGGVGGVETYHGFRGQQFFVDDFLQQLFGVAEQLSGLGTNNGIFQNGGVLAVQLPRLEKGRPVDVLR